jgi:hypothetical protein
MGRKQSVVGGWRQWREPEAREVLEELALSGESAASFARRRGFSTQRLAYWKKRLASDGAPKFLAVALPAPPTTARWVEICAGGVVVRIPEEVDEDRVARLVEAIGRRMGAC